MSKFPSEGSNSGRWPDPRPWPWRALARLDERLRLSRVADGRRDLILLYHSVGGVDGSTYAWDVPTEVFRRQLELVTSRYEPVDLGQLCSEPQADRKRVAITFDDGFRSVRNEALPILRAFGAPATVFLSPGLLGEENVGRFRERHGLPATAGRAALTPADVDALADEPSIRLGNHTLTHLALSSVPDAESVVTEVVEGKRRLEERYGVTVDRFSYPYGAIDERAKEAVVDLHDLAVTSRPGLIRRPMDAYALPRLDACQPAAVLGWEATDAGDSLRRLGRAFSA